MKTKWAKRVIVMLLAGLMLLSGVSCSAKKTIKIGAIFAVTGPAAYLGAPEEKTVKMLVDEYNKNGGINGQQVELIIKGFRGKSRKRRVVCQAAD